MTINWQLLTASWKTTVAGLAAIALGAYQAYMGPGGPAQAIKDPVVQSLFALGVLGLLAKDSNVTGGTRPQPSTPEALRGANQAPNPENPPVHKSDK